MSSFWVPFSTTFDTFSEPFPKSGQRDPGPFPKVLKSYGNVPQGSPNGAPGGPTGAQMEPMGAQMEAPGPPQ